MIKNSIKKIFTTATLLTLVAGTTLTASAREATGNSMQIEKQFNVSGNKSYIDTTFSLDAKAASALGDNIGLTETNAYAGIEGGLSAQSVDIKGMFSGNTTANYALSTDSSVFTKPGVYHYTIKENENETDGVTTDQNTYDVYLYVTNNDDDSNGASALAVSDIVIYSPDGKTKIESLLGTYTTKYFTLKKTITGNAADLTRKWDFTIDLTGQSGDIFTLVQNGVEEQLEIEDGKTSTSVSVSLGKDDEVTIYGLSASDTYSIIEDEANSDGYVTTVESGNAAGTASDNTVVFNNNKETVVAAGLSTNAGSGIFMAILGGGVIVMIFALRRRNISISNKKS